MNIVTVDEYAAPADHRALIANIRTSALAAGWTSEEYRSTNEVWQTGVGWSSGTAPGYIQLGHLGPWSNPTWRGYTGAFLQLYGAGAHQSMNRWRLYGFKTDNYGGIFTAIGHWYDSVDYGSADVIAFGWPTQSDYDVDNTYDPTLQNTKLPPVPRTGYCDDCWCRHITFPQAGTIKQWVITDGTDLIHSIVNIDNVYFSHVTFGILDLFNPDLTDGQFFQMSQVVTTWTGNQPMPHYSKYGTSENLGLINPMVLANGVYSQLTANTKSNAYLDTQRISYGYYQGDCYDNIILQNQYSGKRVIHVPTVRMTDNGLLCPVGKMRYGILNMEGLTAGQILTYGTEEYQVWPVPSNAYANLYGIAYRIA